MRGSNEWSHSGQQGNNVGNGSYGGGVPQQNGYGSMSNNANNPGNGYNINRANRTPDENGQAEVLNQGMYTDPYRNSMPTEGQVRQPRVAGQQGNRNETYANQYGQEDRTSVLSDEEMQQMQNSMGNQQYQSGNMNGLNGTQPIRNPYMTPPADYRGDAICQNPRVDEYGNPIGGSQFNNGNTGNAFNGNNGNGRNKEPEKKKSVAPFVFLSIFGTLLVCILILWGMWKADLVKFGKEKPGDVQIDNLYAPGYEPTTEGGKTTEGTTEEVTTESQKTTEATTEEITTTEAVSEGGGGAVTPNSKTMGTSTCGYIEYPESYEYMQGSNPNAIEFYQAYDPNTVDLSESGEDYTKQNGNIITLANLKETDLETYANNLESSLNNMGTVTKESFTVDGENGGGYKFTLNLSDTNKVAEFWCFKYGNMETVHCFTIECTGDNTSLLEYSGTYSY